MLDKRAKVVITVALSLISITTVTLVAVFTTGGAVETTETSMNIFYCCFYLHNVITTFIYTCKCIFR